MLAAAHAGRPDDRTTSAGCAVAYPSRAAGRGMVPPRAMPKRGRTGRLPGPSRAGKASAGCAGGRASAASSPGPHRRSVNSGGSGEQTKAPGAAPWSSGYAVRVASATAAGRAALTRSGLDEHAEGILAGRTGRLAGTGRPGRPPRARSSCAVPPANIQPGAELAVHLEVNQAEQRNRHPAEAVHAHAVLADVARHDCRHAGRSPWHPSRQSVPAPRCSAAPKRACRCGDDHLVRVEVVVPCVWALRTMVRVLHVSRRRARASGDPANPGLDT